MNRLQELTRKHWILIAAAVFFFAVGLFFGSSFNSNLTSAENNPFTSSRVNLLISGYDTDHHGISRTDAMMVVSIDPEKEDMSIVSVPRDSRVNIPDRGINKANSAYAFGGIDLTIETLESLLKIPIDYYVNLDFQGFVSVVDAIGGVEIEIEQRMEYQDEAGNLHINFEPGKKTLDGEEALEYVRFREPARGDIGRINRQQKFVRAVLQRVSRPGIVFDTPEILNEGLNSIYTDMDITEAISLSRIIMNLELDEVETLKLPGRPEYIDGVSYWVIDEAEKNELIEDHFRCEDQRENQNIDLHILNGTGTPGLAGDVAREMEKFGFNINSIGNSDSFDHTDTEVFFTDEADRDTAREIAEYLQGKPVILSSDAEDADYPAGEGQIIIILGKNSLESDKI
ncbi:LCP family protein [Halarsenatibacter silvermanii]|uniref:Cell envelope-related function transcriptional attenuator common domain-containing protein n=1 Tax=Halarsenatibacter silvermanii TaxID=321763 RepID=A0A1G9SNW1_9FIRM|nr:LCP family protein [Halarsenatibacter silvermanii]SDM37168.1 cell envelope-related function transcriptional attenuator common domain-containing protein [Halarsenatibacter silvermanii]